MISTSPKRRQSIHVRLFSRLSRFSRLSDFRSHQSGRINQAADDLSAELRAATPNGARSFGGADQKAGGTWLGVNERS